MGRWSRWELDAHDRAYRRWVRAEMGAGRFAAFVAAGPDGTPLGSGAVWLVPSQPRPARTARSETPYLLSMFTEPAAREQGVAGRIVQAALAWARARRYPRMTLHASRMGRRVYERMGFVATNEMRRDLRAGGRRTRSRRGRAGRP